MTASETLREYLRLLMGLTFFNHWELDKIALLFMLDPTKRFIKDRCSDFAHHIPEDRFHKLSEYTLNYESPTGVYADNILEMRLSYARALIMNGFKTSYDTSTGHYKVYPSAGMEQLEAQKQEVETLLIKRGFNEVQTDLNAAETHYRNGDNAQCLTMARKALEDLFSSMTKAETPEERQGFLTKIESKSAREIIKSIYGYGCKGHELSIPEYEAVFGYHLIVSSIYFILILFKE